MARNRMLNLKYARLIVRWAWLKLRWGKRLQTDGLCFVGPNVKLEIGKDAVLRLGRWSWIGHGTKIRVHEGECEIGAKSVLGQECTISAFQHVSIGRECVIADRVMLIDFDHGVIEVERPIRPQGIYKRDVRVGSNCWIGYGACILRGVTIGDNCVIGTNTVVTKDVPANAVVAAGDAPRARRCAMRDDAGTSACAWRLSPSTPAAGPSAGQRARAAVASAYERPSGRARPAWPRRPRGAAGAAHRFPRRLGELVLAEVAAVARLGGRCSRRTRTGRSGRGSALASPGAARRRARCPGAGR